MFAQSKIHYYYNTAELLQFNLQSLILMYGVACCVGRITFYGIFNNDFTTGDSATLLAIWRRTT